MSICIRSFRKKWKKYEIFVDVKVFSRTGLSAITRIKPSLTTALYTYVICGGFITISDKAAHMASHAIKAVFWDDLQSIFESAYEVN